jgi:hypothetical protein
MGRIQNTNNNNIIMIVIVRINKAMLSFTICFVHYQGSLFQQQMFLVLVETF